MIPDANKARIDNFGTTPEDIGRRFLFRGNVNVIILAKTHVGPGSANFLIHGFVSLRLQAVVTVQKMNIFSRRFCQTEVSGRAASLVFLPQNFDPSVFFPPADKLFIAAVSRTVINTDNFQIPDTLFNNAL